MALAIVIEEGFTLLEGLGIIVLQPHQTFQIPQLRLEALPGGLQGHEESPQLIAAIHSTESQRGEPRLQAPAWGGATAGIPY